MAYRRKRIFKKRYQKRKAYVPKSYKRFVAKTLAKRVEYKYHTSYFLSTGINNSGLVTPITNIPQGTLDTERVGDQVRLATISFRYVVTVADSHNFVRVILFQYKPVNGFPPNPTAVLNGVASTYLSQPSVDNRQIYQILHDRTHRLDSDDPAKVIVGRCNMKYCKRKLQFQAASATIGSGMIYMLAISDSSIATDPTVQGEFNIWYSDS